MASRRDGKSASLVVASFPRADRDDRAAAAASSAAAAARRSSAVGSGGGGGGGGGPRGRSARAAPPVFSRGRRPGRRGLPRLAVLDAAGGCRGAAAAGGARVAARERVSLYLRYAARRRRTFVVRRGRYALPDDLPRSASLLRRDVVAARPRREQWGHAQDETSSRNWLDASTPAPRSTISASAVTTLEETERTARRVFGGAHPASTIERHLQNARRRAPRPRNASSAGPRVTPPT